MDQLNGVRTLIDRLGLPPRLKLLVTDMEDKDGPLEQVGDTPGAAEVRRILGMVDGQNLLACVVAMLLNHIDVPEEELAADARASDQRTPYERWLAATEAYADPLVLLLVDDAYLAFDGQAERLAGELEEHLVSVGGKNAVALSANAQASWVTKLIDKELDVLLVAESDDGFDTINIAEFAEAAEAEA